MERFNFSANNFEEAKNYLINRAIQLTLYDVKLINIIEESEGAIAYFKHNDIDYQSIYIYEKYRGNGSYMKLFNKNKLPIITTKECNIIDFLKYKNIPFLSLDIHYPYEYEIINKFYENDKAERSGVYFMNHIDEGLSILTAINASPNAIQAYCLHPIFQSDDAVLNAFNKVNAYRSILPDTIMSVMEYRSVANEYLSTRIISDISEIRLSPLKDVNDMLIADKVQNRKDFELYHEGKHPRSKELSQYFKNWLEKLGVSEEQYQIFKEKLIINL